jgi:AAHS family 4-hydroxybenzoate transporter-like MFS transporter
MDGVTSRDPRSIIQDAPMSAFQWTAVAVVFALSALDGLDVLAITLAAPALVREWAINPAALGIVFSVGLIGMAAGSFLVSPLGDVLGRRTTAMITVATMAVGMLLSATAANVEMLAAWRFLTGAGIGGTVAIINPLSAEFANRRRRDVAIGLMTVGFPVGGIVGGVVAAYLLGVAGWRAIFVFGGLAGLAMMALAAWRLPEPVAFLIEKQGPRSLERVNRFLSRSRLPTVDHLPPPTSALTGAARPLAIFAKGQVGTTLHVAAILLLLQITIYFFLNWLPQLVATRGFTPSDAAQVTVVMNIFGTITGPVLGWAAGRFGLKPVGLLMLVGFGLSTAAFGFVGADLSMLTLSATVVGVFLYPAMASIFAVIPRKFPAQLRATGAGFTLGVGRLGAVIGPGVAGYLFAAKLDRGLVCSIMGAAAILAALLLLFLHLREDRTGMAEPDGTAPEAARP